MSLSVESEEGEKHSGCVSKRRLTPVPSRLSDPPGSEAGADQTPSTALSTPIVSGWAPRKLLRFLWTSGSAFQVASAAFSKRALLAGRPYAVAGDDAIAAGSNVAPTTYLRSLNSALFGASKEMQRKTRKDNADGKREENINEHKTKHGLRAQQQHPGQD